MYYQDYSKYTWGELVVMRCKSHPQTEKQGVTHLEKRQGNSSCNSSVGQRNSSDVSVLGEQVAGEKMPTETWTRGPMSQYSHSSGDSLPKPSRKRKWAPSDSRYLPLSTQSETRHSFMNEILDNSSYCPLPAKRKTKKCFTCSNSSIEGGQSSLQKSSQKVVALDCGAVSCLPDQEWLDNTIRGMMSALQLTVP